MCGAERVDKVSRVGATGGRQRGISYVCWESFLFGVVNLKVCGSDPAVAGKVLLHLCARSTTVSEMGRSHHKNPIYSNDTPFVPTSFSCVAVRVPT